MVTSRKVAEAEAMGWVCALSMIISGVMVIVIM